jgi:hypothetical protein
MPTEAEIAQLYPMGAPSLSNIRRRLHQVQTSYFAPIVINVRTGEPIKL